MKIGILLCLTLCVLSMGIRGAIQKVDNLFSYNNSDSSIKINSNKAQKANRELFLGFGMDDEDKSEERRKEGRKDDVKNLIKV